jgi:hypothetical protein
MNIRRGMFLFWVLFTAAWLIGCAFWGYGEMRSSALKYRAFVLPNDKDSIHQLDCPWNSYELKPTHNEIELPYNMALFVHPSVPDQTTLSRIHILMESQKPLREEELRQKRYAFFPLLIGTAFGVPLVVLALGSAVAWALSGFKKTNAAPISRIAVVIDSPPRARVPSARPATPSPERR